MFYDDIPVKGFIGEKTTEVVCMFFFRNHE